MINNLEPLRREAFSTTVTQHSVGSIDYASAGLKVDLACSHLEESLPNRQLERTSAAYKLLNEGVQELGVWLRANGYNA